jgi:hypothetical protein
MKGLILQGARMLQEVKRRSIMLQGLQSSSAGGSEKGECTTAIGAIETEFKDTVHRFVVDLREIIRLQHIITEGDREQGFGGGNNSGPCSLPSRHLGAETGAAAGAGGVSMASSISHRSPTPSELATAAVRTYQPTTPDGQAPKPEGVWQRACVGVGETGEVRTAQGTLAHGIAARRLMSLGQRASREVEHGGIDGAAAAEARDASSQAAQPPFTVHPYRKSRIVYGFKVKEGAMKLKVELQQTEEEEEEEGIAVESDDDDVQTSEAGQQRSKADISDEQFVSMMLDFFGEMEQRKAATRNPRPVASTAAAAPLQAAVPSAAPAPHAEAEPAAGEPAVDVVAPALMRSPPPPQEPCEEGKEIKAEPAASPTKQHQQQKHQQQQKQKADEGGKRRQGSKMREGKWYMCMLS